MDPTPAAASQKFVATVTVLVVIVFSVFGIELLTHKKSGSSALSASSGTITSEQTVPSPNNAVSSSGSSTSSGNFKDGIFSASANYLTPGGDESISVKLSLSGGTIKGASIAQQPGNGASREYQAAFAERYQSSVVGRPISSLSLSGVSGASLTSQAFNDALDKIRNQAQA